jgi:hypothetical protein
VQLLEALPGLLQVFVLYACHTSPLLQYGVPTKSFVPQSLLLLQLIVTHCPDWQLFGQDCTNVSPTWLLLAR